MTVSEIETRENSSVRNRACGGQNCLFFGIAGNEKGTLLKILCMGSQKGLIFKLRYIKNRTSFVVLSTYRPSVDSAMKPAGDLSELFRVFCVVSKNEISPSSQ